MLVEFIPSSIQNEDIYFTYVLILTKVKTLQALVIILWFEKLVDVPLLMKIVLTNCTSSENVYKAHSVHNRENWCLLQL